MAGGQDDASPTSQENLALARTRLANERTMLAYVRTAIMLAATGATLMKLYGDSVPITATGWILLASAAALALLGAVRCQRLTRKLM